MTVEYPLAVGILASYFLLIIFLFYKISPQLTHCIKNLTPEITLFLILAVFSFLSTWTYMFKFFAFSFYQWKELAVYKYDVSQMSFLNSISYWLHDVSLFDSAWRQVCVGAWQWLWSHQLCSLTVAVWTPILAIEGYKRGIHHIWAYMILGQVVAISVGSSLFFAVMLSHQPIPYRQAPSKLLTSLAVSTIGGIITVIISPFVAATEGFMPNLLVMHILLVFPLVALNYLPAIEYTSNKTGLSVMALYLLSAGANFSIYVHQWIECLSVLEVQSNSFICDVFNKLFSTFFAHPAQSSISYDIVCMQIISVAWMYTQSKHIFNSVPCWIIALMLSTPILSASVTLPLFFAACEYETFSVQKIIYSQKRN
ncbi:hypothetical protein BDF21DRAFT_450291 [Thamnidium elegans]|uniref:Uncharacterized protein n=1 Tax=Thamnidium elegans TaxID=101142 RepID=A0A8H7VTG3_9FUNG|nr:hypothetical protein INT48_009774 [Thamnidium elegans]KAI8087095.1 hypothetical protein BDF21DRAFT_450291 [Thamnidium elegans]